MDIRESTRSLRSIAVGHPWAVFIESIAFLLIAWGLIAHGFDLTGTISSPELVGEPMFDLLRSGDWIPHVVATLRRVLYGFILTLIVGTGLGVIMGWSRFWQTALKDYVIVGLALPSLFAVVFAAMWFGFSDITPMVAGALISFPFVTQNVYTAIKDIDAGLVQMSHVFGVSRTRVAWRVVIQSILPAWFAGTRYAFAICWKITTLAELIVAENGIGFKIQEELSILSLSGVLTWTFFFTIIILFLEYGVLRQIEKRVFAWREDITITLA